MQFKSNHILIINLSIFKYSQSASPRPSLHHSGSQPLMAHSSPGSHPVCIIEFVEFFTHIDFCGPQATTVHHAEATTTAIQNGLSGNAQVASGSLPTFAPANQTIQSLRPNINNLASDWPTFSLPASQDGSIDGSDVSAYPTTPHLKTLAHPAENLCQLAPRQARDRRQMGTFLSEPKPEASRHRTRGNSCDFALTFPRINPNCKSSQPATVLKSDQLVHGRYTLRRSVKISPLVHRKSVKPFFSDLTVSHIRLNP